MTLRHLELVDFRSFAAASFDPDPEGTTVLIGPNGTGKTTVLEAVAYLGTQRSFRGAPRQAVVRTGAEQAVLRAQLQSGEREVLVEAEISLVGRSRAQVNRQPARSRRDLAAAVPVTVFSPEDLGLVQGGPARRRELLDDALRVLDPRAAAQVDDLDRILRQRGALLRQARGRLSPEVADTLAVWDARLATAGEDVARARGDLAAALGPHVARSYASLAGGDPDGPGGVLAASLTYGRSWDGDLAAALAAARTDDLRRAATTVGPHRDELHLAIAGRDARVQASQGEQRCLALALRLGVHRLVVERGVTPTLLLDDVFSELDPDRSRALVAELPGTQALLTTASPLPHGVAVAAMVDVRRLAAAGGAPAVEAG